MSANVRWWSDNTLNRIRRTLAQTYVLLRDPARHTTGTEARNAAGNRVGIASKNATQYCLVGGVKKAGGSSEATTLAILDDCAVELFGGVSHEGQLRACAYANDTLGHEAAMKMLRCGMQKIRAELKRRRGQGAA